MQLKRPLALIGVLFFSFILSGSSALGAQVVNPAGTGGNVTIGTQETHKNLYAAGGNLTINGNTQGDLTAAGGMVTVTGNVENELLMAGGNLDLSGAVGGTARLIGGNITVNSPIGGDLAIAGGNVTISDKAVVNGDLLVAGGTVVVNGPIKGDIRVAGGVVVINSKVGGGVYAQASQDFSFGSSAQIAGQINYKGPKEAMVAQGAQVGKINYTKFQPRGFAGLGVILTVGFLIKLLGWALAALVMLSFRKKFTLEIVEEVKSKPWQNLGWGLLVFIAAPILTVVLLVTVVGYYVGFLLGALYLLCVLASGVLSALILGYLVLSKLNKPGESMPDWQVIVIGVVVWCLLSFIPVLGWLVMAVLFLMVLGTGAKKIKESIK